MNNNELHLITFVGITFAANSWECLVDCPRQETGTKLWGKINAERTIVAVLVYRRLCGSVDSIKQQCVASPSF